MTVLKQQQWWSGSVVGQCSAWYISSIGQQLCFEGVLGSKRWIVDLTKFWENFCRQGFSCYSSVETGRQSAIGAMEAYGCGRQRGLACGAWVQGQSLVRLGKTVNRQLWRRCTLKARKLSNNGTEIVAMVDRQCRWIVQYMVYQQYWATTAF